MVLTDLVAVFRCLCVVGSAPPLPVMDLAGDANACIYQSQLIHVPMGEGSQIAAWVGREL